MIISIGSIAIDLSDADAGTLPSDLEPWVVKSEESLARCSASPELPRAATGPLLFDSQFCWRVNGDANDLALTVLAGDRRKVPFHALSLNSTLTVGRAFLDSAMLVDDEPPFLLRQPMHELWTSFLLMRGRGLLVHGLGVLHRGKVYIFAGKSGVGKSTLGGVFASEGVGEILSDDRLIIRPESSGFRVYGTPWHGEARFSSPVDGPLGGIFFLHQAPSCQRIPIGPAAATANLFSSCFVAGWPRDEGLRFTLNLCAEVSCGIPCAQLHFTPDSRALDATGCL